MIHGDWSVAGEIEPGHEMRQFIAVQFFMTLDDAIAVHRRDCQRLGGTWEKSKDRQRAERFVNRERTGLMLWISSRRFHYLCWVMGLDPEATAELVFRILNDDAEAVKQYDTALKEFPGAHRMIVRNG